jgi:hypothetical protein
MKVRDRITLQISCVVILILNVKKIDSADEFLGECLITGDALEDLLKSQKNAGEPNLSEHKLNYSTVPAFAQMKKYVGGNLKIGTFKEQIFKVMVVEADKLATPEGAEVNCYPEARVFWKDQLIGKTSQTLTSTNPLWLNQSVSLDWSNGVITEAVPKIDEENVGMAGAVGSAAVAAVHDLKANKSASQGQLIMPKTGRRQSLAACPPDMFNFLTHLAEQIKAMNDSVSNLFQALDLSCNGSIDEKELQAFFTKKGTVSGVEPSLIILNHPSSSTQYNTIQYAHPNLPFNTTNDLHFHGEGGGEWSR